MKGTRAFTLIELLVVIAIIAILAAILFPVFAQAKLAAKKTQDLSNVKQIVTAIFLYANDNDDSCPAAHHDLEDGETIADLYTWYQPLFPYVKSRDIFRNPVVNDTVTQFPNQVDLAVWNTYRTDYLINGFYSHGGNLGLQPESARQILIGNRHDGIAFFDYHPWASAPDGNWERGFLSGSLYQIGDVEANTQIPDPKNVGRFTGGDNYGFVDGHAKYMKFRQTLDPSLAPDDINNVGMHNVGNLPANE